MTKSILLKAKDDIFLETEEMVQKSNLSRNAYINKALDFFNKANKRKMIAEKLAEESFLVRETSLETLEDFQYVDSEIFE